MPQVPYTPVPTARPGGPVAPELREATPGAAFGENIGAAVSGVGRTLEGAGSELFQSAQKIQEYKIEAQVNQVLINHFQAEGDLDNKFRLLPGEQAEAALEGHKAKLKELYESSRSSLPSPAAQRMFDQAAMRRFSYDTVNASEHAATQMKQYTKQTQEGLQAQYIANIHRDPSEASWRENVDGLKTSAAHLSRNLNGDPIEVTTAKVRKAIQLAAEARAGQLAKHNVPEAQAFLDRVKPDIDDPNRIQEVIDDRGIHTNAALITSQVMQPGDSLLDRAMKATGVQESGARGYRNVTTTINQITGQWQSALGRYGVMESNLPEWSRKAGFDRTLTRQEFLAHPEYQDQMYRAVMGDYISKFGVEAAGRAWIGGKGATVPGAGGRTDALRTRVDSYGRRFAELVGSDAATGAQHAVDIYKLAEEAVNKEYPTSGPNAVDPALRQRALEATFSEVTRSASFQQKELRLQEMTLKNDINKSLETTMANGKKPWNMQQLLAIDPNADSKLAQLRAIDPMKYERALEHAFRANANQENPGATDAEYTRWKGMTADERADYNADAAFNDGLLTDNRRKDIKNAQATEIHRAETENDADAIIGRHTAVLDKVRAFKSKTNSAADDRYLHIRGALQLEIEDFVKDKKHKPDSQQEDQMMDRVIEQVDTKRTNWWGSKIYEPRYEQEAREYQRRLDARQVGTQRRGPPQIGEQQGGRMFKGGDPKDPSNWPMMPKAEL